MEYCRLNCPNESSWAEFIEQYRSYLINRLIKITGYYFDLKVLKLASLLPEDGELHCSHSAVPDDAANPPSAAQPEVSGLLSVQG